MTPHDHELQQEQQVLQHFRQHSQGEPSAALDALILNAAREALAQPAPQPSRVQRLHAWLFGTGSRTRWSVAFASLATVGIGLSLTWRTQEQLPSAYDLPAPMAAQAPAAPVLREMAPQVASEAQPESAEFEQRKAEAVEKKAAARQSITGAMEPNASFSGPSAADAAPRPTAPAKPQLAPLGAMADSVAAPVAADAAREEARSKAQAIAKAKAKAYAEMRAARKQAGNESGGRLSDGLDEDQLAETLGHSEVDEAPPLELRLHNVLRLRREGLQTEADQQLAVLKRAYPQLDLDAELKRLQGEAEKPASSP